LFGILGQTYIAALGEGTFQPTALNLSTKTSRVLERLPDEDAQVRQILIRHRDRLLLSPDTYHTGYMYIWSAIPDLQQQTGLSYRDLAKYMLDLNLDLIARAPLVYFQEVTYSFFNFWLPATTELSDFNSRNIQLLWTLLHYLTVLAYTGVSIFLGGFFLFFLGFSHDKKVRLMKRVSGIARSQMVYLLLAAFVIWYSILVTIFTDMGVARHRVPVELLIFTSIFLGVDIWLDMRKDLAGICKVLLDPANEGDVR